MAALVAGMALAILTPDLAVSDLGVRIAASPGKGMGAFATRVFNMHEAVGDYRGELITLAQHEARYEDGEPTSEDQAWRESRRTRGISATGDYVVRVHDDLLIDAEDPEVSSWCRFINHDSSPNLAMKVLPKGIDGKPRVWFVAQRPVAPDEELCFDYGPDFWSEDDGVETAHHIPVKSDLQPSPWYNQARAVVEQHGHEADADALGQALLDDLRRMLD